MADQYNSAHTGAEIDQAVSDVQNNKAAWSSKPQPSTTTPKAPGTASAGSESAYARGDHVHPKQTVHDNDMLWGGNSLQNNVSPVDAAAITTIGGNKFALAKPDGITVEYSNDGGTTWADYGVTDSLKVNVVSGLPNNGLYLGKKESSAAEAPTANDMLRVTIDAMACGGYTSLEKILIQFATNGVVGSAVKIESANIGAQDVFTEVGTYPVAGNSGWNSIPLKVNFGAYVASQTSNCGVLRFTFSIESIGSSSNNRANVQNIVFLGITNWITPSELAKTGHLYAYDYQQNASFPAKVTAKSFSGAVSDTTAAFSEAGERTALSTGEKLSALFGKISKWLNSLGDLAFKDAIAKKDLASDVPLLPDVAAADNGKILRVVDGAWAAVEIANANGGSF